MIRPLENKPFSLPGDSGSAIYTEDKKILGFIVGADDQMSLGCSAGKGFEHFDIKLL